MPPALGLINSKIMTTGPTISESLQSAEQKLCSVSDNARLDAEILLSQTLDCTRTYLRTWPQHTLTFGQYDQFLNLLRRRSQGEPIAYITGKRDFWDMTLQVSPDTLIPRPETEHLVEMALEKIPQDSQWHIADLGTGCGAIALAIAKERAHCKLTATDASPGALIVAQYNARNLGVNNVTFVEGHWLEPFSNQNKGEQDRQQFEMIISNPPYIHPDDPHLGRGDLRFEPMQALRSMPDGLSDIRTIAETARKYLVSPGWLILEHGYDQGPLVKEILNALGYSQISTIEDLAKNDRVTIGKWEG